MRILKVIKFNSLVIISIFLVVSLFVIGEAFAVTYYVDKNNVHGGSCSDSNNGTSWPSPFCTIQKAADVVNPGDTVIVTDGTYTDTDNNNRVVNLNRAGTSDAWITFKSENKWGAKIDGTGADMGFNIDSAAAYIRVEDFEILNVNDGNTPIAGGDGVLLQSNSDTNTAHHIYLYRLKIHDIVRTGTYRDNGLSGVDSASYVHDSTIDSCIFYNIGRLNPNTTPSASESSCTAPNGQQNCTNPAGCVYCYNFDPAIYSRGGGLTIINNIFYQDIKSGWPIQLYAVRHAVINTKIINNTFYGPNPQRDHHIVIAGSYGFDNILIQNNIFSNPRNYAIDYDTNATNITIKNNLVYGANLIVASACSDPDYTCTDNIVGQDPKFVDLKIYNFRLQNTSPAINKGLSFSGRTKDADGKSIVGAPDIGAYEYSGTSGDNVSPAPPEIIQVK